MFKTNNELMNKASFQKQLISMPTIELVPEEADRFIDYIFDQSVLKNNARQIKMAKQTKNIRAMGLGAERILHPGATFSSSDYKQRLIHNTILLTAKKVRACAVIHDDDLEDNIEGDEFMDHVMKMITKQIANELDEAYWIGDTHDHSGFGTIANKSTDARCLWDGWRYIITNSAAGLKYENKVSGSATILSAGGAAKAITGATADSPCEITIDGHGYTTGDMVYITGVVGMVELNNRYYTITVTGDNTFTLGIDSTGYTGYDSNGVCVASDFKFPGKIAEQNISAPYEWEFKFGKAIKRLPSIYKLEGLANLRFFTNDQVKQDYVDAIVARSTPLGDQAILGKAPIQYGEVPTVSCPLMAITLDADGKLGLGNYTDCLLTHKDNLIIGVHREIKIETERQAADEATYFYCSLRSDVAIENVNAVVLIRNLTIG